MRISTNGGLTAKQIKLLCFERSLPVGAPTVEDVGCRLNFGRPGWRQLLYPPPMAIRENMARGYDILIWPEDQPFLFYMSNRSKPEIEYLAGPK